MLRNFDNNLPDFTRKRQCTILEKKAIKNNKFDKRNGILSLSLFDMSNKLLAVVSLQINSSKSYEKTINYFNFFISRFFTIWKPISLPCHKKITIKSQSLFLAESVFTLFCVNLLLWANLHVFTLFSFILHYLFYVSTKEISLKNSLYILRLKKQN